MLLTQSQVEVSRVMRMHHTSNVMIVDSPASPSSLLTEDHVGFSLCYYEESRCCKSSVELVLVPTSTAYAAGQRS